MGLFLALILGADVTSRAPERITTFGGFFTAAFAETPVDAVTNIVLSVWILATIIPTLALTARRLHDTGRSGWLQLLQLVPFVGGIIVLAWTLQGPRTSGERFDRPGR